MKINDIINMEDMKMGKLGLMIKEGFGKKEDYSCSERIVYGANIAYDLGLDKESLKMAAGLSGGMYIEEVCGAIAGGILVLSKLFVKDKAHEGDRIKILVQELIKTYNDEMKHYHCKELKEMYRTPERGCGDIIFKAADILDRIIERELGQ